MKKILASIAVLAAMALAVPAMAADAPGYGVTIGGRIKADMGWQVLGDDIASGRNNTDDSLVNYFMSLNGNSYIRALFTSADKSTGAHIEFGFQSMGNEWNDGANQGATTSLRIAYGWWNVGSCKLLVGQFFGRLADRYWPNSNLGLSKSGKSNLTGFGYIGGTRNAKVALQMDVNDNFGFEVAIGQAGSEVHTGTTDLSFAGSFNNYLPRLEATFDFKFGGFMMSPGFGISYQEFAYNEIFDALDIDDSVLSYLLYLPMQYTTGPFRVGLTAFYGQNTDTEWTGEYGSLDWSGYPAGRTKQYGGQPASLPAIVTGEVEDTQSWGASLSADYAFTEQLSLSLGAGFTYSQNDAWGDANGEDDDYIRWAAFIALPYKVTSNFTIAPEIAYYNYGDMIADNPRWDADENEAGDEWLLGVHFQFLF